MVGVTSIKTPLKWMHVQISSQQLNTCNNDHREKRSSPLEASSREDENGMVKDSF